MQEINFVFGILIILLLESCKNNEANLNQFRLLESQEKEINLSDLSDEVEYVKLDLENPIVGIDNICISDSFYFISIPRSGIFMLDTNGKEVNKIGNIRIPVTNSTLKIPANPGE